MMYNESDLPNLKSPPKYGLFSFSIYNDCLLMLYTNSKQEALKEARQFYNQLKKSDDPDDQLTSYIEVAESTGNPDCLFDGSGWNKIFDIRPGDNRY